MIQKITAKIDDRVETGVVQFNDDWPGLFIRGDGCMELAIAIGVVRRILEDTTKEGIDQFDALWQLEKHIIDDVLLHVHGDSE